MSRTHSTDPYLVRIWFSPDRGILHDHRYQACDAPITLAGLLAGASACRWGLVRLPRTVCSCGHRHETWWREENRRTRHRTRWALAEAAKSWRGGSRDGVDDLDGHPRARR